MVMIEMRDSLYDTAFDLLDEAKLNAKKTKLTLCELENAMYDCYESIKEEENGEDICRKLERNILKIHQIQ